MTTTTTLRITLPQTLLQLDKLTNRVNDPGGSRRLSLTVLENLLDAIKAGAIQGGTKLDWQIGATTAVRASQTFTWAAKATAGKVCAINGHNFTGRASGASGDEYNRGSTAADTAYNMATAFNASTTSGIAGLFVAVAPATAASATAKCTSVVNTNSLQVGPVLFTVKTTLTSTAQASTYYNGTTATGEVLVGGTDGAMATNLAAAVNNHPTLRSLILASASSDTVTLTARNAGSDGNKLKLAQVSGATITCSTATLADGHDRVGPATLDAGTTAAVVTIYALQPGALANAVTTSTDDSGCTAGGSVLAGGAGEDVNPVVYTLA